VEIAAGNLVQLETGHRVELAIPLYFLVVDVVVAEAAEEEIREFVRGVTESG